MKLTEVLTSEPPFSSIPRKAAGNGSTHTVPPDLACRVLALRAVAIFVASDAKALGVTLRTVAVVFGV